MTKPPPRPDESDFDLGPDEVDDWTIEGSAGRSAIAPNEVDAAARTYWEAEADSYQAEHGAFLAGSQVCVVDSSNQVTRIDYAGRDGAGGVGFVWGPEGVTENELGLLGPIEELRGRRVLEVGCGAAQCSAWLAARGVQAVGIDIAMNQLRHAQAARPPVGRSRNGQDSDHSMARFLTDGGPVAVVAATATALPFGDAVFDGAFASYGAIQFVADLPRLLGEVRRVLRPGGFWAFSVTHPIRWAFPDDPAPAGLTANGSYFDRTPYVERDANGVAVYAEFHRTISDYVAALRASGFSIERIVEPEWPDWNDATWGGWSKLRGTQLPGTLIMGCRAAG